jgi:hypothetical protein
MRSLSSEAARTSAFPNETWERGIGSSEAGNAKGVAILQRRVGAPAPTLEEPKSKAINPERVESVGLATNSWVEKDSTFSRLDSAEGKTRVGAARQPFALFLQRLWRCGRGNGVARTSAFPSATWERGTSLILFVLVFLLLGVDRVRAEPTPLDTRLFSKADLRFFFDSVTFDHGKWRFELSQNSMGMLWRTIDGEHDVTGVCSYRQTLVVPETSSVELKTRDISILFRPNNPENTVGQGPPRYQAGYVIWKRLKSDKQPIPEDMLYASSITVENDGHIEFMSTGGGTDD